MRRNTFLLVSVGLNAVLVALLLVARQQHLVARAHLQLPPFPPTNGVRNLVVMRKQFFSWQELESADYRVYVKNLRDIGCPEQTIRDIIIADVNQLYARKRLTDVPSADQEWWRAEPDANMLATINAKAQELEQERRALLASLLGPDWETANVPQRPVVMLNGPILGQLSAEVKLAVQNILKRSQLALQAYLDAQKAAGKTPEPSEIARLAKQMRTDLAQVLSPDQMDEFLLRYSQSAASLRQQLRGINVTPEEFRNLFHLTDSIEEQIDQAGGGAQAAGLQKDLDALLKSTLGPDRYQAYRLAQDPLYRDAVSQADEVGAPPTAVKALYDLNKATAEEEQRINSDPKLTPEQAAAQIGSVEAQAKLASDQILGLAPPPPPTPPAPPPNPVHNYSPGETVDQIAAQYGVTSTAILNANPNLNFNNLSRGAPITIPAPQ